MVPSKGKGGASSGLADRRILRSAESRSVRCSPGRAFPQERPRQERLCRPSVRPRNAAGCRGFGSASAVVRHRPSTDYRVKRETRMLRKKSEGLRSPGMPERASGRETRCVPDFAEEARGARSGEISPDVSAGRRDGHFRTTARKRGSLGRRGNGGKPVGKARDGAPAEEFLMMRCAGGGRCVFLGELPDGGGAARRGGAKGFPRVPGPDLIPCLERNGGRNWRFPRFLSSSMSDPAGSATGCRSPGEVVRRRHVVGGRSPTRLRSTGVSHPRYNARRQGRRCPPFLPNPARKKAACVSGGSAERLQFSRTGRARQRGRRSRRREPDPAGGFSMVMHLMIRREEFGCNRSGAGIFRKDCRATERWHDLGAWRRERRRSAAQRRGKVLSPPPWGCMLRLWEKGRQAKGCEVGRAGHQFRAWRDFSADIVASTKRRFLNISYCQSY